jgi:hypothetical protein
MFSTKETPMPEDMNAAVEESVRGQATALFAAFSFLAGKLGIDLAELIEPLRVVLKNEEMEGKTMWERYPIEAFLRCLEVSASASGAPPH